MPAIPLSAALCTTEALGMFPHFLWSLLKHPHQRALPSPSISSIANSISHHCSLIFSLPEVHICLCIIYEPTISIYLMTGINKYYVYNL